MTDPIRVGRFDWERAVLAEPSITGLHLCAVLTLGTFMRSDGSHARPGFPLLARQTGIGESTLRRYMATSTARGWLVLVRRGHRLGDGTVVANEYAASVPASTALPGERLSPDVEAVDEVSTAPLGERLTSENGSQPLAQPLSQALARGAPIKGTGEHKNRSERDRSSSRRKKRDLEDTIIDTLREVTGKTVPATWVPNVRRAIFGGDGTPGPGIEDPASYAEKTIRNEPNPVTRFLPLPTPPRLNGPQPAEPPEPTPPHQPEPDDPPAEATATVNPDQLQTLLTQTQQQADQPRPRRHTRPKPPPRPKQPPATEATADEEAHRAEQLAALEAWMADNGHPHTPEGTP